VERENHSACATVNWKVYKSAMALYGLYVNVIKGVCVTKVLVNPIIRTRTRLIGLVYHHTRDIFVSEVGCSDHIGFFSSGYDREYMTTGIRSDMDFSNYWT
jgi:hypothetical protein